MQTNDADQLPTYAHLFEPEQDINNPVANNLETQWAQIQEIYEIAKLGNERPLDEAYWIRLADRILSTETKTQANLLELFDIRQQKIEQSLLPLFKGRPIVNKVDLALGFTTTEATEGDIIEVITLTRTEPLSQMSDPFTSTIPLPCGIRINMRSGDQNEGITRLATWFAAGLARLSQLSRIAGSEVDTSTEASSSATRADPSTTAASCGREIELLPLVGWTVVGHDWRFYVSWKEQSGNIVSSLVFESVVYVCD